MMPTAETMKCIEDRFGPGTLATTSFRDNTRLTCPAARIAELLGFLKNQCGFDMLVDVTAVDYQEYPDARDRYGVVYCLTNTASGERLFVRVFLNDPSP